jgi:putative acetyltransferase
VAGMSVMWPVDVGAAGPFDPEQATMGAVYRLAKREDAGGLYDIRRRSILELAPPAMPEAAAQAWASQLTLTGMERKLRELEVWVAELDGIVVGWGPFAAVIWRGFIPLRNLPGRVLARGYWSWSSG